MRIALIGSGNVATVFGKKLLTAGHEILQVCNHDAGRARELAEVLRAEPITALDNLSADSDLCLVAVSDTRLAEMGAGSYRFQIPVAHTAGSVSMEVLNKVSVSYGVFYPLQTIRKEATRLPDIPLLIDGNTEPIRDLLFSLAKSISDQVAIAGDKQRMKLHVAAVIANNFSNRLYALTQEYCDAEGVDFSLLIPLIREGATKLSESRPALIQTGPAIRKDLQTIEKHKALLQGYPELLEIYKLFTENILAIK